jgi:hypothetical protein
MGEGNENLVYLPHVTPRDLYHAVKSYDTGPPALLPIRREGVLRIFIALKIHRLGPVRTANFGPSGKHANHYTTKVTSESTAISESYLWTRVVFYKYPHNIERTSHSSHGYVTFFNAGVTHLSRCELWSKPKPIPGTKKTCC